MSETVRKPWGVEEKTSWLSQQTVKRSYQHDVVAKLEKSFPKDSFEVVKYGVLSVDPEKYQTYIVVPKVFNPDLSTALITGGVHGYETSGVHGALRFIEEELMKYSDKFNIVVAPCISPWAYETVNRWNNKAVDPNRSFTTSGKSEESSNLMKYLSTLEKEILVHIDLHETTDTDATVFCPALAARDATDDDYGSIPDGFYLCGDTERPQIDFQVAVIESVSKVTHIAEEDEGQLIGTPIAAKGLILYPTKQLGLCIGVTNSKYVTTTEVYPDSPRGVSEEDCIKAQVAAVTGGLDYVISKRL
jgi:hypothetical protein